MDKKIANSWIKALESGDYKQGKCALRNDNDCFCCLGVLCDLYDKDRKQKKKKSIKITNPKYNGNKNFACFQYGNQTDYLPTVVREWAGMSSNKGWVDGINLSGLNDGDYDKQYTFKDIAKFIKKHIEIL
jgi:hypothetical protein